MNFILAEVDRLNETKGSETEVEAKRFAVELLRILSAKDKLSVFNRVLENFFIRSLLTKLLNTFACFVCVLLFSVVFQHPDEGVFTWVSWVQYLAVDKMWLANYVCQYFSATVCPQLPNIDRFPQFGACYVPVMSLSPQIQTVLCHLPSNLLSEKVFVVLQTWFFVVLFVNIVAVFRLFSDALYLYLFWTRDTIYFRRKSRCWCACELPPKYMLGSLKHRMGISGMHILTLVRSHSRFPTEVALLSALIDEHYCIVDSVV